jgi:putative peptidoglycan lipid II flippase
VVGWRAVTPDNPSGAGPDPSFVLEVAAAGPPAGEVAPAGAATLAADPSGRPGSPSRLIRSAGLVGAAVLASRVLGLIREQVLAYLFGASHEMDAFNVAFRIPNLFRDLFAEGAMSASFVPTFTRCLTLEGKEPAWRLGNYVLNGLLLASLAVVLAGTLGAWPLVTAFAGDYAAVPGKLELTASLVRIIFPVLLFIAVAATFMGMLNSLHQFFIPSFSPAMFNVATIVCAVVLVPLMPHVHLPGITAIAIATLLGGLGQIAIQWPPLRRAGYRYRPEFNIRDGALHEVLLLMGPGLFGIAAVQVNLFVNTALAAGLGPGTVSWLNYAFRLMYMPIGLFGVSVATAALPGLSGHAARGDVDEMRRTVSRSLRLMLMLNVPATTGLVVLAVPIVRLLFEHGQFTPVDTRATAVALSCYAPGLVGYAASRLLVPTFYALGDSRTPVAASLLAIGVNLVVSVLLMPWIGFRALALGTALASLLNAAVLLWLLRVPLRGLDAMRLGAATVKIAAASVVMAMAARATDGALSTLLGTSRLAARLAVVGADIGVALIVLAAAAHLLAIAEFREARAAVWQRVASRR